VTSYSSPREQNSHAWRSACDALASAERAGVAEDELEQIADQIISSRHPLPSQRVVD
jgi:hypothetical protein